MYIHTCLCVCVPDPDPNVDADMGLRHRCTPYLPTKNLPTKIA